MAKLDVYNMEGAVVGEIELSDTIFGLENPTKQLCTKLSKLFYNKRQVQRQRTRSERRGGGRKPYRQKVRSCRQGSIRSRSGSAAVWYLVLIRAVIAKVLIKMRRLAMKSAFTTKLEMARSS